MKINAIIPAGGTSSRYGAKNKLLEILNGKEVIMYSVEKLNSIDDIQEIVIPASKDLMPVIQSLTANFPKVKIIQGGSCRQESVYNAIKAISNCDLVLIHDAARPLIKIETILNSIEKAKEKKAVITAVKAIDTIKKADNDLRIIDTPDRNFLWNVQTPQVFDYELILSAHIKLAGKSFSDDAGLLEALGCNVFISEGDYSNIKITAKSDLIIAQEMMKECNN